MTRVFYPVLLFPLWIVNVESAQPPHSVRDGNGPNDPGIRTPAQAGAGQPLSGLTAGDLSFFNTYGTSKFSEVENVSGGLGPRFNLDSCAGCHAFPAPGGSSPPINNPQVTRASFMAPGNSLPSFLTGNGPVREVRFINNPDGTPDGGVHAIFTISGRTDKPAGCAIGQPDFSNHNNLVFRIPTPVFGAGLIESITDTTIRNNLAADQPFKKALGIGGHVNSSGNDGSVTRFGWKAQNKSLLIFSAEAYNVEMGVTNEGFPNERDENPQCATNQLAEDHTGYDAGGTPADIVSFMGFMRFLDQPRPACGIGAGQPVCSPSVINGKIQFLKTGCALCHTPVLITGNSPVAALNQKPANLFSDLAVHHMGANLADHISQGTAGPDEFRTAPLWGVGQRAFFLHDGRTGDLLQAIMEHDSPGSEASGSINAFRSLSNPDKQDLLQFLRSL